LCFVPLRSTSAQASIPLNSVYTIYFILPYTSLFAAQI